MPMNAQEFAEFELQVRQTIEDGGTLRQFAADTISEAELGNAANSEIENALDLEILVDNQMKTGRLQEMVGGIKRQYEGVRDGAKQLQDRAQNEIRELDLGLAALPTDKAIEENADNIINNEVANFEANDPIAESLRRDEREKQSKYDIVQKRVATTPKNPNPAIVWIVVLLIAGFELFINYPVFLDWLQLPLPAFLLAVTVACAVAFHAENFGKSLKQKEYKTNTGRNWILIFLTSLLIVMMLVVFAARFFYYAQFEGLGAARLGGGTDWSGIGRVMQRAFPTMAQNFGAWVIGLGFSYFWYEYVPELRETYRAHDKADKKYRTYIANYRQRVKRNQARLIENEKNRTNNNRIQFTKQKAETSGLVESLENWKDTVKKEAENKLTKLAGNYRRCFGPALREKGIPLDEIGFRDPHGTNHNLNAFSAHNDSFSL